MKTIILLTLLFLVKINCDLPVHCLRKQIAGDWVAELTTAKLGEELRCGHDQPDNPDTNYKAYQDKFQVNEKFDFNLKIDKNDDNVCQTKGKGAGTWTMIYDEGFQINLDKMLLFAHSHYSPKDEGGFKSECDKTSVGWWHDKASGQKGCFRAFKIHDNTEKDEQQENKQEEKSPENLHIVQPKEFQKKQNDEQQNDDVEEKPFVLLNSGSHAAETKTISAEAKYIPSITATNDNEFSTHKRDYDSFDYQSTSDKDSDSFDILQGADKYGDNWDDLDFSRDFTEHQKVVDRLNAPHIEKSWTATSHDIFDGMTLAQLNRFAGRRKSFMEFVEIKKNDNNFKDFSLQDVSDLPKEKTFIDSVGPVREQGDCGSCYIFATMGMLQARLKLKYNENVRLSVQHAVDCDYFNQGCDGGYPFLVEKFASEQELVSEECHPYQAQNGMCSNSCDISKEEKIYKVQDYRFIGGQYGHSNERNIMLELMHNGPLVVSFEPAYQFMHYSSGVYHSVDANNWIKNGEKQPDWEKVDHSVLLVGWGEDQGEKYWQIQNTWGTGWGEKGFFRIRRGTDESNIESLAEAADPIIIEKNKNKSSLIQKNEESAQEDQNNQLPLSYNENYEYNYGFLQMQAKAKKQ